MHALFAKCCDEVALEGPNGCVPSRLFDLVDVTDGEKQRQILQFLEKTPNISTTPNIVEVDASSSSSSSKKRKRKGGGVVFYASEALIHSSLGIGTNVTGVRRGVIEIIGKSRRKGCSRSDISSQFTHQKIDLYHLVDNLVASGFIYVHQRDTRLESRIYLDRFAPTPDMSMRLYDVPMTRLRPELFCLRMVARLRNNPTSQLDIENIEDVLPLKPRTYRHRRTILRHIASFTAFGGWAADHLVASEVESRGYRTFALNPKETSIRKRARTHIQSSKGGACVDRSSADLLVDSLTDAGSKGLTGKELMELSGISSKRVYNLCNILCKRGGVVNHTEIAHGSRSSERRYFINEAAMNSNEIVVMSKAMSKFANVTLRRRAGFIVDEVNRFRAIPLWKLVRRVSNLENKTKTITRKNFLKIVVQLQDLDLLRYHEYGVGTKLKSVVALPKCPKKKIMEAAKEEMVVAERDSKPSSEFEANAVKQIQADFAASSSAPAKDTLSSSDSKFVRDIYPLFGKKLWRGYGNRARALEGNVRAHVRILFRVMLYSRENFDTILDSLDAPTFFQSLALSVNRGWFTVSNRKSAFRLVNSATAFLRNIISMANKALKGHFNARSGILRRMFAANATFDLTRTVFRVHGGIDGISCNDEVCQFDDEAVQRRRKSKEGDVKDEDVNGVAIVKELTGVPGGDVEINICELKGDESCMWMNGGIVREDILKGILCKVGVYALECPGIDVDWMRGLWRTFITEKEIELCLEFLEGKGMLERIENLWFPLLGADVTKMWKAFYDMLYNN